MATSYKPQNTRWWRRKTGQGWFLTNYVDTSHRNELMFTYVLWMSLTRVSSTVETAVRKVQSLSQLEPISKKKKKNRSPYKITWTYSQKHFVKCTTGLVFDTTRNYDKSIGYKHICESLICHMPKLVYVFHSFRNNAFEIDKIPARLQLKIEHASWRQLTRSLDSGPPVETRILFKPTRTLSGKPLLGK